MGKKFSLKNTISGAVIGSIAGPSGALLGGGVGAAGGLDNLFGDKTDPADAEAAILKRIKLNAALAEERGLKGFEDRLNEPVDQIIRRRISEENKGLRAQGQDQQRMVDAKVAQRGLQNSSIGFNAKRLAGNEAQEKMTNNMSSFAERLDEERLKRLTEFRNAAGATLANQDVGIKFQPTTREGFGKTLLKSAAGSLGPGIGMAVGGAAAGRGARTASATGGGGMAYNARPGAYSNYA